MTRMIREYILPIHVLVFYYTEFDLPSLKSMMECISNDLENVMKNGIACPKRILNLESNQQHHLQVKDILLLSPFLTDRIRRFDGSMDNFIVFFDQKQRIFRLNKNAFVQRAISKFFRFVLFN